VITVGIDIGAKTVKVIVMKDGKVVAKAMDLGGFDQKGTSDRLFKKALAEAGVDVKDVKLIMATGAGKGDFPHANEPVTEVTADARGASVIHPKSRTIISVGAEEGRAIRTDAQGKVVDFAINEKCAAGAGAFTEAMARALELKVEDLGPLSLQSTNAVPMNAQCAVFAESEVVSLVAAGTSKPDISRAIHDAIASRISSMARRISVENDVVLIGGVAKNKGFVESLKRDLATEVFVPQDPEFVSALGAARIAYEKASNKGGN
jgi:benzoyl-CoA reductase subunit D